MEPLNREELWTLEAYAEARPGFRAKVMAHKKLRQVPLGEHATLYFEDRLTIQYQVQEMLRVERIFEKSGIQEELAAYNPLIPNGTNLKATFMLEYPDAEMRRTELAALKGVEDTVWVGAAGGDRVFAIADEDMERENEEKTSSVHFLRFELDADSRSRIKQGAALAMGIEHPRCRVSVAAVDERTRAALAADLD